MTATLESTGQNRYKVVGPLTFATVSALLRQSQSLFESDQRIEIDLTSVRESDSAGLALLIEWMRRARARGHAVTYQNVPEQLCALARISEVDGLLVSEK